MSTGSNQTLGMRNNNPLNIRFSKSNNWKGQSGENKGFCVFETRKYGYRAAFINLRSYSKRGLNTIEKIIMSWAPPVENNTESYIKYVVDNTGLKRTQVVAFNYQTSN